MIIEAATSKAILTLVIALNGTTSTFVSTKQDLTCPTYEEARDLAEHITELKKPIDNIEVHCIDAAVLNDPSFRLDVVEYDF